MKRHMTASAVSIDTRREGGGPGSAATRTHAAFKESARTRRSGSDRSLALASVSVWNHTLLLTGDLTHRSAHLLEMEIERLCEQGVTGITLDLRGLTHIDSSGVAVIAFRSGLCKRRGCDFALIAGSPEIQQVFQRANVVGGLPFQQDDVAVSSDAHPDSRQLMPVSEGAV